MRILCVFGRHNYGDPVRGEGLEYTHFLPALNALGHDVFFFESFSRAGHANFASLNRSLLQEVERFQPDVVFTVLMLAEVWLDTIELIRRTGCKVMNWSTDDSWKYREFSRLIATDFDLYATTCPDAMGWYKRDGIQNAVLTQWAASSSYLATPRSVRKSGMKVCFIGSAYGNRSTRVDVLRAAGIEVECFGHGWPNGSVAADHIPELLRDAEVCLNFSEAGGGSGRQIKARIFEVPAAGGMLLTESAPHLEDYFLPGREIMVFRDDGEMVSMAWDLLNDPQKREAMAQAAHERVIREHTYEQRLRMLLDRLEVQVQAPQRVDWPEFERCAIRHHTGWWLTFLRVLMVLPCVLVWGKVRGPRAARRALFELCWRLAGRHTYTAAGWPGRLFYHES